VLLHSSTSFIRIIAFFWKEKALLMPSVHFAKWSYVQFLYETNDYYIPVKLFKPCTNVPSSLKLKSFYLFISIFLAVLVRVFAFISLTLFIKSLRSL
jgi:hypothetical protein